MTSPLGILLDLPQGRRGFVLSIFSSLARAVGIVLIAEALVRTIVGSTPVAVWVVLGLIGAALRGASLWADHSLGTSLAAANKQHLRSTILGTLLRGRGQPRMNTAVTVTRGIDGLDDYFTTVVPALSAAAVVPLTLLIRIVFTDVLSAVIIALCLPLVPVFMILIGRFTKDSTAESTTALAKLSDHLAELAEGLPVLIGLGRSKDHARRLRALSDEYHKANLATLRIAFLSSLALELIATISVALVAVVIGLRLVSGSMDLGSGLFVLLLAPECFIPLRELGSGFHASENGRDAQDRAHALIASTNPVNADMNRPIAGDHDTDVHDTAVHHTDVDGETTGNHRVVYADGTAVIWKGDISRTPGVTAVRGPSGAGKSTVLAALTGSLPVGSTTSFLPQRSAFVPQTPRVFAATIGAELDTYGLPASKRRQALLAASLPADESLATSALSPGQLRRLALVRVMHRTETGVELLVLDEPTAHLDDENAAIVLTMIAEAARRIRVVLASHDDRVQLLADEEIIPRTNALTEAGLTEAGVTASATVSVSGTSGQRAMPGPMMAGAGAIRDAGSGTQLSSVVDDLPAERSGLVGTTGEVFRRRWSSLRSSLPVFNRDMVIALLSSCASSLAAISLTAVSAWLIVEASYQPPIMILMVAIVGVRFFGLSRSVLLYLSRLKLHSAIFGSLGRLRSRLWAHFEKVGMSDRKMLTSDTALRAMVSDADDVRDLIPRTLFPPIASSLVFVAVVIAAWLLDSQSVPMFLALGILNLVALPILVIRTESALATQMRTGRNRILSLVSRALQAKTDLATNGADGRVLSWLAEAESTLEETQRTSSRNFGAAQLWLQLSTVAAAVLIAVTSSAPTEVLAVVVLMALGLGDVFSSALGAYRQLPGLGVVLDRLPAVSGQETAPALEPARPATRDGQSSETGAHRFAELALEKITVGWDEEPVLRDVDLHASRGRWTVLCGDSGSGKSTTLSVLLRFVDPWSGRYRATRDDGRSFDVLGLEPTNLAGTIAWCPQEAHIFRSTVRGNLAIARKDVPTDAEMAAALRTAGLMEWADAQGLDRWVGDHGTDISGGQRQRLAVARTLLSGAGVIVLDEPTAHLDVETGERLMAELRENLGSHTVVMVTHDRRLIADDDDVVEVGSRVSPASTRT
ncbi:thiol reductant ABC exporter subunit CydC [Brevibacterium sp. ZH18]|uniref:thiol reductant ABC exporter subunit CydC n=1 Tax=Brevibacterium sp. ZH18 TaxID=2927784 RepID=UPI001F62117B|nr:thiol reductant ABC exporter subunit CydC [Brevibacterium sp. ZH18]MCI4010269.1 thiol reductant ABC exporter subunit CydC [Brevibacterium sp. ZH18]